jgi:hypothetical protein
MFGFCSTQKGVQNLLEMNLQIYFIKEKGNPLFFSLSSLVLARWPNQPASSSLPQAQEGTAPLSPSAWHCWPRAPHLGPARRPSRGAPPPALAVDALGRALCHYRVGPVTAVSYLSP